MAAEPRVAVTNKRPRKIHQIHATVAANGLALASGTAYGFSAVVIPQLQTGNSTFTASVDDTSWIASMFSIGSPAGCLVGGVLLERLGPRTALMMDCVPFLLGWVLIACAQKLPMIYAGRFLKGLADGASTPTLQVYVCEITEPSLRGTLGSLVAVDMALGILLVYVMGATVDWRLTAGICALLPFFCYVFMSVMPESPTWLLSKKKHQAANSAMTWLRGDGYDASDEIRLISENLERRRSSGARQVVRRALQPSVWKPFLILVVMFLIQQFSGINAITFYAVSIFQSTGSSLNDYLCSVIFAVVRLTMIIIASLMLYKYKRRHLCIVSGIILTVSMAMLSTSFWLKEGGGAAPLDWLPLVAVMGFIVGFTLGYGTVPWLLLGEIFPADVRGPASGVAACVVHIFIFLVVKTFPSLVVAFKASGTFWFYTAWCVLAVLFPLFILPETKGKTLEEIEEYFTGRELTGTELTGRELTGTELTDRELPGTEFTGREFTGRELTWRELRGRELTGMELTGREFTGRELAGMELSGRELTGRELTETELTEKELSARSDQHS